MVAQGPKMVAQGPKMAAYKTGVLVNLAQPESDGRRDWKSFFALYLAPSLRY